MNNRGFSIYALLGAACFMAMDAGSAGAAEAAKEGGGAETEGVTPGVNILIETVYQDPDANQSWNVYSQADAFAALVDAYDGAGDSGLLSINASNPAIQTWLYRVTYLRDTNTGELIA